MPEDDPGRTRDPVAETPTETTPTETTPAVPTAAGGPSGGRRLGRFRLEALIGEGGMGRVYESWDPRLERRVALKLIEDPTPRSRQRFVREARLQAGVSHPGVCPVFEVGEVGGAPYIVMPRLSGRPLDRAAEGLPLERKLLLMRRVAEAVHAAHRTGLIHRDLKPSNVLVEEPDDGPPHPVVLDFGIARPLAGGELTETGETIGTPAYMAPEQVEGELDRLDRRTDVYALGATLYRLLAGRPPFEGRGAALLLQVLKGEPAPLRPLGVPADVEAIVLKCLEKERHRRYDSALALAEDLRRYLDGEPVSARRVGVRVRLAKWLRRHRATVRVAAVAGVLLLGAVGWGARTAWRADQRERLARSFAEQVEEVEALVRYSHLSPLHDVRPDRAELRRRMDAIRATMERAGAEARGLGHYALGRGHLALDELEEARRELATAWELGPKTPEVAAALGRALSELYRDRLTALERVRDRAGQETLRARLRRQLDRTFGDPAELQKQLQRTYGEPARELLARGRAPGGSEELLLEALILFHDGRTEDALALLERPHSHPPWSYEPVRLEGDLRRSWAVTLHAEGREEDARRQLDLARASYARASAVAESDAAVFRDDAQAVYLLLALELAPASDRDTLLDAGLASVGRALTANPDDPRSWLWRARLHRLGAERRELENADPNPHLAEGIAAARRALELDHRLSAAWVELGRAHWRRARWLRDRGDDPAEELELAAAAFERVSAEDREYVYFTSVGTLRMTVAGQRAARGLDATADYRAAVAAYRAAAERHSAPFAALTNLGVSLWNASGLPGTDPREMLRRAVETLERARDLDSDHMAPHYYLGLCHLRLAQGGDPASGRLDPDLAERALASLERAAELAPERFQPFAGLGELRHFQALAAHGRGDDPGLFFARAREAYGRARELAPDHPVVLLNLAWTAYFQGKFRLRDGGDPTPHLDEAEKLCRRTLEAHRRPTALLCLGSVLRLRAEHRVESGGDPAEPLAQARALFEEIASLDPGDAEAHRSLGCLFTLEARWRHRRGEDPRPAFDLARRALDRALELEDDVALFWLADARWQLEQARWLADAGRPATAVAEAVAAGQRSAEEARRRRPEWREVERVTRALESMGRG